jgi:hypothetical protein
VYKSEALKALQVFADSLWPMNAGRCRSDAPVYSAKPSWREGRECGQADGLSGRSGAPKTYCDAHWTAAETKTFLSDYARGFQSGRAARHKEAMRVWPRGYKTGQRRVLQDAKQIRQCPHLDPVPQALFTLSGGGGATDAFRCVHRPNKHRTLG